MNKEKNILFLCTGNSCRSQMAEGLARTIFPKNWNIHSAGTVAIGVHPLSIEVMKEIGIDISKQYSKTIDDIPIEKIDIVITLCGNAKDRCPVFPRKVLQEHWPIDDPISLSGTKELMTAFRRIRDDIHSRIKQLAKTLFTSQSVNR